MNNNFTNMEDHESLVKSFRPLIAQTKNLALLESLKKMVEGARCAYTSAGYDLVISEISEALTQHEQYLAGKRAVAEWEAIQRSAQKGGPKLAITGEKLETIIRALRGGMSIAAACRTFEVKRT